MSVHLKPYPLSPECHVSADESPQPIPQHISIFIDLTPQTSRSKHETTLTNTPLEAYTAL